MLLKNGATDQKLRGGYYTPEPLADSIVKLFVDDVNKGNIQSVLDLLLEMVYLLNPYRIIWT